MAATATASRPAELNVNQTVDSKWDYAYSALGDGSAST